MKTKAMPTWHLTDAQTVRIAKEAVDSLLKMDLCSLCKAAGLPLDEVERILAKLAKDRWIDVALNSPGAGLITVGATVWNDYTLTQQGIAVLGTLAPQAYKNMVAPGFKWLEHLPPKQQEWFLAELIQLACLAFMRNFQRVRRSFHIFVDNKKVAGSRLPSANTKPS